MDQSVRCPAGTGTYTWREGDTPASVAARYGVGEEDLRAVNPDAAFQAGEEVCVPAFRCAQGRLYIVHRGDTFASIAAAYGISVEALSRSNPFVEPDALAVGQVLCVPAPEEPAPEEPPAEEPPAEEPASCPEGYAVGTVQAGESYADLLVRADVPYLAFRLANPELVPGRLRAGQEYCVPPRGTLPGCPLCAGQTVVRDGEDLAALAKRLGVSVGALLRRNPALAPSDFTPGRIVFTG